MRSFFCAALCVVLLALTGCAREPERSCPESAYSCPAEWAQWPLRTADAGSATFSWDTETVTDNVTGLMWEREESKAGFRWAGASKYCEALGAGGHDDWRLPSKLELMSLVEYERSTPAGVDPLAFPNAIDVAYWTGTRYRGELDYDDWREVAWVVSFYDGTVAIEDVDVLLPHVRCVRTERAPFFTADSSSTRWVVRSETVFERNTGLTWQRQRGPGKTQQSAALYCAGLTLDGLTGFRLPHVKELASIAGSTAGEEEPPLDPEAFPPIVGYSFSEVTEPVWTSTFNYAVDFGRDGEVAILSKLPATDDTSYVAVRCVRTGAAP